MVLAPPETGRPCRFGNPLHGQRDFHLVDELPDLGTFHRFSYQG